MQEGPDPQDRQEGDSLEVQPVYPRQFKPWSLGGTIGVDMEEVETMRDACNDGDWIVFYEFLQGMRDYGVGYEPPPRIWIEYKDGRRIMFTSNLVDTPLDEPISAIEFINGGEGLMPENLTAIFNNKRGDEDNDEKFGLHGRGLKVALAFLGGRGITVEVKSYAQGEAWIAKTAMKDSECGATRVCVLDTGEWIGLADDTQKKTIIRINNPDAELCSGLATVKDLFIEANPDFPDATVVPKNEHQKCSGLFKTQIDKDRTVMCLNGFINTDTSSGWKYVFIDGLRVPIKYPCILPWAVKGFSHEATNSSPHLYRTHDSRGVSDEWDLGWVIKRALIGCTDKQIWIKLLNTATRSADLEEYIEFNGCASQWSDIYQSPAAAIVKQIWEEKYGSSLIGEDTNDVNWYREQHGLQSAILVPPQLHILLRLVGIKTVDGEMKKQCIDRAGDNTAHSLVLDSVHDSDAGLSRLIENIAGSRGTTELIEIGGKRYLKITLPGVLENPVHVHEPQTEIPVGLFARKAAIVSYVGEYDTKIFSLTPTAIHTIDIHPSIGESIKVEESNTTFTTKTTITSSPRSGVPGYDSFEAGKTYILFDISHVNAYHQSENPDGRAGEIAQDFAAALAQVQEKAGIVKRIGLIRPESSDGYSCVGQTSICQVEVPFIPKHKDDIVPVGHYRSNVAAKFVFDEDDRQTQWLSKHKFIPVGIPRRKPPSFDSRLTITNIQGREALRVPSGHIIVGAIANKGANVFFLRDFNTGVYQIKGTAQKVIYYTAKDPNGNQHMVLPPTADEQENFIDERFLNEQWRDFIVNVRGGEQPSNIEKILLAQEKWQEIFKYDADMEIDDLINKNSSDANQAATGILNCARGICNVSATGFALLLRAIGVPSRVCMGTWVQHEDDGYGGRHMWVEAWTGSRWMPFEPGIGIETNSTIRKRKATAEEVERTRKEYELDGMPKEIKEADMPPEEDPGRIVILTRHELETLLTSDAVAIREDDTGERIILRYWIDNNVPTP